LFFSLTYLYYRTFRGELQALHATAFATFL
jgi:hypothetical protein